jgi:hypothetical protein
VSQAPGAAWEAGFRDLDGRVVSLRQFQGSVVIVHVFTTWDLAGLRSVPELRQLAGAQPDAVKVVGVGMDLEGARALAVFRDTLRPDYPVWVPDAAFATGRSAFGPVREVPRLFIVGQDGTIRRGYAGYVPLDELLPMVAAEQRRR